MKLSEIKISISEGNTKLGAIPSISLPPKTSCKPDPPCFDQCYAMKAYAMWPSARKAWNKNYNYYKKDPVDFFRRINGYIAYKQPPYFRWHVAGDIPDQWYLNSVIKTARKNVNTAFMVFTKRFDLNFLGLKLMLNPISNLKVILSRWPGDEINFETYSDFPMAWMQDGTETRIPSNAFHCKGTCDDCFHCWSFTKNRHVYFDLH